MTRHGKIARLPRQTRDELNRRIDNGEPGVRLVEWLNGLPETQKVLSEQFDGRPINEPNLSEWKSGGFLEWQAQRDALSEARELVADGKELTETTSGELADQLVTVLCARYAGALRGWTGEASEEFTGKLRALRSLCRDIVELRRSELGGARLKMVRELWARGREKTEEDVFEIFYRWATKQEVRDLLCRDWISPEERERHVREILGLGPKAVETREEAELPDLEELKNLRDEQKDQEMRQVLGISPEFAIRSKIRKVN